MPVARLLDIERARAGALCGLGVIVSAFSVGLLGVWIGLLYPALDWRVGLSALALAFCGTVASVMVTLLASAAGRVSGMVGLAASVASFVLLLGSIWASTIGIGAYDNEMGETVLHLAPLAALACACLVGIREKFSLWTLARILGGVCITAAFVMGMFAVWIAPGGDPTWYAECIIIAVVVAHANLIIRVPLPAKQRWFAWGTIGSMVATAACASYLNFITRGFDQYFSDDLLPRVAAALGIITGCATLAMIVLNRINRRAGPGHSAPLSQFTSVLLACPRCGRKQHAPVGRSGCTGCGLLLTLGVAEPRCPACEYVTLDLKTDTCPECGARLFPKGVAIPAGDPLGGGLTPPRPSAAST